MSDLPSFIYSIVDGFQSIVNSNDQSQITLELEDNQPLFHEAGVFFPGEKEDRLFVTSNQLPGISPKKIILSLLVRDRNSNKWSRQEIREGDAVMPNGAVNSPDMQSLLICSQGNMAQPSTIVRMNASSPYQTSIEVQDFHGRNFNSVNDVVVAKDGAIWFTDPDYGFEQGFRPRRQLPNQVYRYDPVSRDVRVVVDGIKKPNGLCFSPDEQTMYITDTDWIHGDGSTDLTRASHIYAYTVKSFHGAPFLTEKRVFAMADNGIPDGIKCDTRGNVYSGCGDGINVWAPNGVLLGKIFVPGGAANFCFGRPGEVFILNETKFWVANVNPSIEGDLLHGIV